MTKRTRIGCVVAAVAPIALVGSFIYYVAFAPFGPGLDCMLKSNGRGIWTAIISANAERDPKIFKPFWPKDQGFNHTRSSTEYFRMLMATGAEQAATNPAYGIFSDLLPGTLAGHGVPRARTIATFSGNNNAWIVICVSNETSADTTFLISRNVDLGKQVSCTSKVTFVRSPIIQPRNRVSWITCGGDCFDARPEDVTAARLFPDTNATYDVMYP